ncbi:MAG: hypothetical protein SVT56_03805 [Chloroflexota bacterium]|nr:hypothetical protein [Chloroflexota bacterium]
MAVTMGVRKAAYTTARYYCANCWGQLTYDPLEDGKASVHCRTEGCQCEGFVSKSHIEHQERRGIHEKVKAMFDLKGHVEWLPDIEQSNDEILEELGF